MSILKTLKQRLGTNQNAPHGMDIQGDIDAVDRAVQEAQARLSNEIEDKAKQLGYETNKKLQVLRREYKKDRLGTDVEVYELGDTGPHTAFSSEIEGHYGGRVVGGVKGKWTGRMAEEVWDKLQAEENGKVPNLRGP